MSDELAPRYLDASDWLERLAAERRAESPTFAESEAQAATEGGGWVVERPLELENGEIEWVVVAESQI